MATNKITFNDLPKVVREFYPRNNDDMGKIYRTNSIYGYMYLVYFRDGNAHIWDKPKEIKSPIARNINGWRLRVTDEFRNRSINPGW